MSFYNWIQEKLFDNYEEWRLKSPDYNGNGFNIVGIDNTLKAMHDGFFMYIECRKNIGYSRYILRYR